MTVKLSHCCDYELKSTGEVVHVIQAPDNRFWYWENFNDVNNRKTVYCTVEDFSKQVFLDHNKHEIENGDIVVYLHGGYNSKAEMDIGQVIGFRNSRVTVQFFNSTSNLAPNNLLIVTEAKVRANYSYIK